MRVRPLLELVVSVYAFLAGFIFAFAEGGPIPAIVAPAAVVSYFCVWKRGIGIPNYLAGLLGLVSCALAIREFFSSDIEGPLLALGHLLSYVTVILLLQKKRHRDYARLIILASLQVAVSGLLTSAFWLSGALLLCFAAALLALHLLHVDRLLALQEDVPARVPVPARVRNFVVTDGRNPYTRPRFWTTFSSFNLASLLLAVVLFILLPRAWTGQIQFLDDSPLPGTQPLTGFAETVRLGDIGEILESDTLVMEVTLSDPVTEEMVPLEDYFLTNFGTLPLFRGRTMCRYVNGEWEGSRTESRRDVLHYEGSDQDVMRYDVTLSPIGSRYLFTLGQTITVRRPAGQRHDRVRYNHLTQEAVRSDDGLKEVFKYYGRFARPGSEYTDRRWPPLLLERDRALHAAPSMHMYHRECLDIPARLGRLDTLVRSITIPAPGKTGEPSIRDQIQKVVHWLRDSGHFAYSLDLAVDDPTVDPVEDFLINRRRGHCEYFATSLALMLRTLGVPTRLVSGFKGGEYDEETGVYEVRQLHAHAWVEAFVDGRWEALDPTPAAREAHVRAVTETLDESLFSVETMRRLWTQGIYLTQSQQREMIYSPVAQRLKAAVVFAEDYGATVREVWQTGDVPADFSKGLYGGVTLAIALLLILVPAFIIYRLQRRRRKAARKAARDPQQAWKETFPVLARLFHLLEQLDIHRAPHATPREYARHSAAALQGRESFHQFKELPSRIAEAAYRVRYGRQAFSPEERKQLEQALDRLQEAISSGGNGAVQKQSDGPAAR